MDSPIWWKQHLDGLTALQLPTDFPRYRDTKFQAGQTDLAIDATVCAKLQQLSQASSAKPSSIIKALLYILLHKWTREEDITIASSSDSCNLCLFRVLMTADDSFSNVLEKLVAEEGVVAGHALPYAEVAKTMQSDSEEEQGLLYQVRFFDVSHTNADALKDIEDCDWTVFFDQKPEGAQLKVVYNDFLFSKLKMTEMLNQIQFALGQVAENPAMKVSAISLHTEWSKSIVPDPTAPLDDTWRGSIQSIFAANAEKHPDRPLCVGKGYSHTYGEIHSLSNRLANFLVDAGVQVEDRVCIFAHRSAPLVVAVMGILKSGGTSTNVDPAYPPSRQLIYLQTAKPKAIVLLKAAGPLDSEVKEYLIANNITILEGLDMEMVQPGKGGQLEGLSDMDPKVEVTGDNVCTLGFTSGSTGIPKGVCGRHTSLTHFYPWMAEEFGIGEKDRFTMLSGIAHDPIQRDIFTPTFFGAEIRIPEQDDIVNPGRLAQWCAEEQVTVAHLTPAMGQILTANASTQIPTLKNVLFVGDVLTKPEVKRLQNLAPNVCIVNMFGSTETQRSVSYLPVRQDYPIAQSKDILPAGVGMKDVQLLILNPSGQPVGVGEAGEIFVRSYHMAKGYLGLDNETKEKFLPNPFNPLDPKDRVYRTGDVGRYLDSGIVECGGRADDQVKIRGFRLELREIDTYLVQHAEVREALTLLRKDLGDEPRLVAYMVPEKEGELDQNDIRAHLKSKLPSYAIPTYMVQLASMPLNPNGKIDKNKLPKPDVNAHDSNSASYSPLQKQLIEIWGKALGFQELDLEDNFFDVGGHSVLATKVIFQMRAILKKDVPIDLLHAHPTVAQLAVAIETIGSPSPADSDQVKRPKIEGNTESVDLKQELQGLLAAPTMTKVLAIAKEKGQNFTARNPIEGVFLTGATGFLGAFILSEFMALYPKATIYCLVRAKSDAEGQARIVKTLAAHGLTKQASAEHQFQAVAGDLSSPLFGLTQERFDEIANKIDIIVHNGAMVHWVYPYSKLKAPNTLATIECLKLATTGDRLKSCNFVSSTSVLDTAYFVNLGTVMETDTLDGAVEGLTGGYGQSKWISEKLIMACQAAGLPSTIIRPGYIVGHSTTGVTNTDDFLWRVIKGCLQLGCAPQVQNRINMCPVDYVAAATVRISTLPSCYGKVHHISQPNKFTFEDFFAQLTPYGWPVKMIPYLEWSGTLSSAVATMDDSHPMFPLLHIVLDDFPSKSLGPGLDAANTAKACTEAGCSPISCAAMPDVIGSYFSYLIKSGFLSAPPEDAPKLKELPKLEGEVHLLTRTGN